MGDMLKKNTSLQGSTLSAHRMTTGFSPFILPTLGLLQKGVTTPCPRPGLRSPALELARGVGKLTYGLSLSSRHSEGL